MSIEPREYQGDSFDQISFQCLTSRAVNIRDITISESLASGNRFKKVESVKIYESVSLS
jgi:hypothetical protein